MSEKVDISREAVERIAELHEADARGLAADCLDAITAKSLRALLAANESLAKDAERWRGFRRATCGEDDEVREKIMRGLPEDGPATEDDFDAAVDAALAASTSAKEGDA